MPGHLPHTTASVETAHSPPATQQVGGVGDDGDTLVDNRITARLLDDWRGYEGVQVQTYEFSADHDLIHDMIDPTQPEQQTALVYPILLDYITGTAE